MGGTYDSHDTLTHFWQAASDKEKRLRKCVHTARLGLPVAASAHHQQQRHTHAHAPGCVHARAVGGVRRSAVILLGNLPVGGGRHRALMFKLLGDSLDIKCAIRKGVGEDGCDDLAVVLVQVDGQVCARRTAGGEDAPGCHLMHLVSGGSRAEHGAHWRGCAAWCHLVRGGKQQST